MPLDGAVDDVEADYEILEAVGRSVEDMIDSLVSAGAMQKTLRRWLTGHSPPEYDDERTCLLGMAADLELFTPSMSGRTAVDRYLSARRAETHLEHMALEALGAAQFRLVTIVDREGPDLVRLRDLFSGESLQLLDARISPLAAGLSTAMRLCPLASGRLVLISPLFAIDETSLAAAMTFARPGRGVGHRCAASLYRDVARRGFMPIPQLIAELDEAALADLLHEVQDRLNGVQRLAIEWMAGGGDEAADLVLEARRLACVDNLVDACGCFGQTGADAPQGLAAAFERIAELQVETIVQRARAGLDGYADMLDLAAAAIAGHIARGDMEVAARDLFIRLRARWDKPASRRRAGGASADLDRVIERIRALRAKTVDRGCTEAEAMAAAAKVSELLGRHDLTLDEVAVRESDCAAVSIAAGRKRRAPVDACINPLAGFCDCRVWLEDAGDGLRYVFFGLKADVEAARLLRDLIELAFETESTAFRRGEIYLGLRGGDRRLALNSFQVGLASGIVAKLAALKDARQGVAATSGGFDLVAVKHSVVDAEMAKLGLDFTSRSTTSRRYVHGDAYEVGKAAGALFEPHAALGA